MFYFRCNLITRFFGYSIRHEQNISSDVKTVSPDSCSKCYKYRIKSFSDFHVRAKLRRIFNYIGETGDVLRIRVTVHKQQITDPHTRMLGVSKHIDECAAVHRVFYPKCFIRGGESEFFTLF